jgi:hypothetical protein
MQQQEGLPLAAMSQENIRTIRANPPGFKPWEQAPIRRDWARYSLCEAIARGRNELSPHSRRGGGHKMSAIDRHNITPSIAGPVKDKREKHGVQPAKYTWPFLILFVAIPSSFDTKSSESIGWLNSANRKD